MTNNKKDLKEKLIIQKLQKIKCITCNVKIKKSNKKAFTFLTQAVMTVNLIFQAYAI